MPWNADTDDWISKDKLVNVPVVCIWSISQQWLSEKKLKKSKQKKRVLIVYCTCLMLMDIWSLSALFSDSLLSPCAHSLLSSHPLKLFPSDSPPPQHPLVFLRSLPLPPLFHTLSFFPHFSPPSLSQQSFQPAIVWAFILLCVEFLWNCVKGGEGGSPCACVASQHINLLSSSRRQACACCSMCLCNL